MCSLVVGLPRYALLIGQGKVLARRNIPGYSIVGAVSRNRPLGEGNALEREVGLSWLFLKPILATGQLSLSPNVRVYCVHRSPRRRCLCSRRYFVSLLV